MPQAVVVGAGISGLTAALCLTRIGWRVTVLEQAEAVAEVGAGLQISPNGMKVLHKLGVADAIEASGFTPEAIEMRIGRTGRQVFRIPLGADAVDRWGERYLHVHRADLVEALISALEPGILKTGKTVSGYSKGIVHLVGGEDMPADLVVGADGVHSIIRSDMLGQEKPDFGNITAWRMTVPVEKLCGDLPPPTACIWVGEGRHAVTYRLRGGRLVNFVGLVHSDEWTKESWSQKGSRDQVVADFLGWHPTLTQVIEAADAHYLWALHSRAPLKTWSDGPVIVIGDAAHPMLPSLAQGAVMGIEDAWVLAALLADGVTPDDVGQKLYNARIDRVSKVQTKALSNARNFHVGGSVFPKLQYGTLWATGKIAPGFLNGLQDWLYGEDVTE